MADKKRVDVALVERGLASSREKAQALVMSGVVYIGENKYVTDINEALGFSATNINKKVTDYVTNVHDTVKTMYEDISDLSYPIALCIDENGNYVDKVFDGTFVKASFVSSLATPNKITNPRPISPRTC